MNVLITDWGQSRLFIHVILIFSSQEQFVYAETILQMFIFQINI